MKQNASRASAMLLLAVLLCGCASSTISSGGHAAAPADRSSPRPGEARSSPAAAKFASSYAAHPCQTSALALRFGPELVPMTGEHGAYVALVNRGRTACALDGYPGVVLYGTAGEILPFRYVHGASGYVTRAAPRPVLLPPGASAYVLVAKYRCDIGISRDAATMRLTLPGSARPAMWIGISPRPPGVLVLSYCEGGPGNPGQIVDISPIEPAPSEAGPFASQ